MDLYDFPATQVYDKNDDFEPTQNTQSTGNSDNEGRKQVGVLIANGTEYPVYTGTNTIGRHASNNIVLKDSTISKYHAEIEGRRKVSFICDLKPCNTTVLNKEKLLPNRLFEISDGASLRFGGISAIYRKLSSLDESILKTPAAPRCNEIIASTPDSVLNTTDDDSSVVYGTQKNSAGPSEFHRPSVPPQHLEINRRNLSLEFLSNNSLLNAETGSTSIYEQETQAFSQPKKNDSSEIHDSSGIHDFDIQEFSCNKPDTSSKKSLENSNEIHKADTQVVSSKNVCTDDNIILDANTQAVLVNLNPQNENLNPDHEIDDEGICSYSTQPVSLNSDKIHEEATQAFAFKSPVSHTKKLNKYSETLEEFSDETSVSTKSGNIHEEVAQAFPLQSPKSSKLCKFKKSDMIIEDSDTDEEGIFEEATQKVLASRKIYEEATQVCPVKSSIKTGRLGNASRTEDSDTDEDGIFESSTHKYATSFPQKMHKEASQDFVAKVKSPSMSSKIAKADLNVNDSDTDEEGIFEKATQAVSPNKSGSKSDFSLKSLSKSHKATISTVTDSNILNDSKTDEENCSKPRQKYSPNKEIENLNISGSKNASSSKANSSFNELGTDDEETFRGFEGQKVLILVKSHVSLDQDICRKENYSSKKFEEKIEENEQLTNLEEIFRKADSKHEDSETDDEGVFRKEPEEKNPSKIPIHQKKIVESKHSDLKNKDSKSASKNITEDSETDDEATFQEKESSTKELGKNESTTVIPTESISESKDSKSVVESPGKVVSKTAEDSETDDEIIFQKEESSTKELEEKKSETLIQKEKMLESKYSSGHKNSKPVFESSEKAELKNVEDSETNDEVIFQKRESTFKKYNGKTQLKTSTLKENLNQSKGYKSEMNISKPEPEISRKDSKVVQDSEIDDEGIFQNEFNANRFEEKKSETLIQKAKMPESKNSNSESKGSSGSKNSKSVFESSGKASSKNAEDSEIDDVGIFQRGEFSTKELENTNSETLIQKEEMRGSIHSMSESKDSSGPKNKKCEFKSSAKTDSKNAEDSETDDEVIFQKRESIIKKYKGKKKLKRNLNQFKNSKSETELSKPELEISGKDSKIVEDSKTDDEVIYENKSNTNKLEEKKSGTPVEEEQMPRSKNSKTKLSISAKYWKTVVDSVTDGEGVFQREESNVKKYKGNEQLNTSSRKEESKESKSVPEKSEPNKKLNPAQSDIDDDAPTQMLPFDSPERESIGSRNASIENFEYEMAPTQLLEDFEESKMKTLENKQSSGSKTVVHNPNSGSKTNSGRTNGRRSNPKMHDTIEDNLNEMFEGEGESIDEPSQMLTQQLANILEESQMNEALLQTPSTSRKRTAQRIETSSLKTSPSLSERSPRSKNSPQGDADNCSPRMSKLNIIRSKKETKVTSAAQNNSKNEKSSKDKTEDTRPPKKRPLKMSEEEPETSTGGRGKRSRVEVNEELEITTLFARRSLPFDGSPNFNKKANVEEKKKVMEPKKNLQEKTKVVKGKDPNSVASSTVNDSLEKPKRRGRPPKIQKTNSEAKVDSTTNGRVTKRTALSSSSSLGENSVEASTSTAENLKVPSKAKKPKIAKPVANEVENEENEVRTLKTSRGSKRQVHQSKEIIRNNSSSSSLVESSFNETAANSMTEKLKKTETKKTATRGRKKKEVMNMESMMADNSSASSSMISLTSGDGNSSAVSTPTRAKRSKVTSPLKHQVLFTGVSADDYRKSLSKLGLTETEDGKKFTVLVTDKVRRTLKFLRAASQGIPIVSVNWLVDSANKSKIQELENYIVKDPAAEAKFGFNLSESLKKARDKKMLEGYTVVLTPNISAPPPSELKEMVLASGGKAVMRPPAKWPENTVVVSDETDLQNAKKIMAKAPKTVTLHTTEFLLTGILKQEVDLHSYLLKIK